jgi:hypothetical protein
MTEGRVAVDRTVYAFTPMTERAIGSIDAEGQFRPNEFFRDHRELLPTWPTDAGLIKYDAPSNQVYYEIALPGPAVTTSNDFLPLSAVHSSGEPATGPFAIEYDLPSATATLLHRGIETTKLASAKVPTAIRRDVVEIGSFDNSAGTYLEEAEYRPGRQTGSGEASLTITVPGVFADSVIVDQEALVIPGRATSLTAGPTAITIDGRFDDWRNVSGVDDTQGDVAPYLEYVADVDLLEFKVAHDRDHLYLYARVAGQVGRSHPNGGRSYFYAYIDVDQDAGTGFLPTRDDDCYFGVDIGDDCEVQFEFVNNVFRKSFYGFCGLGGDADVLRQQVKVGKSVYGRFDANGREREHYKSEYIVRGGKTEITEDLKLGTSDTIRVAVSPDGREVEIASQWRGFLKDASGRPILAPGQTIDLAAGMECDSKAYVGKSRWAADSTPAIRGYRISVP